MHRQAHHVGRYAACIRPGLVQPLEFVPFHGQAPLLRRLMAGGALHPAANLHVAVHEIRELPWAERTYCRPHAHTCGEVNLLLAFDHLVFRFSFDDEVYLQPAPATVFIPPGVRHSANVVSGTGFFIAILTAKDYTTTFADGVLPVGWGGAQPDRRAAPPEDGGSLPEEHDGFGRQAGG